MTISLAIKYRNQKRRHMPVATHHIFVRCWLPSCSHLGLKWIPHFETGYPVIHLNLETLPEVIDELQRLKGYFVENGDQLDSPCVAEYIIERIERLLFEMRNTADNWDEIEYVHI